MNKNAGNSEFDQAALENEFRSLPRDKQEALLRRLEALKTSADYYYTRTPVREQTEILELFIPQRLEYLPELYGFLREQLQSHGYSALFAGYSVYGVQGAFRGEKIYKDLAQEIIQITKTQEEEIWILQYSAQLAKFVRKEQKK